MDSMHSKHGGSEIKKLQEMVAMIPEEDFQSLKKNLKFNLEKMWMVKNYLKTLIMMAKLTDAFPGPTKYKPASDSGDSAAEVPLVPTTKDKIKKKWSIMKKPAASKTSSKSTVKTTKVKTKEAGEKGNFKTVGKKRFKMTLASHQSYIQFQEEGQQKWSLWVACSQGQCLEHHEVIKKIFQEMPSSKKKAVELRNFLI